MITASSYTAVTTDLPLEKISELSDHIRAKSAKYGKLGAGRYLALVTTLTGHSPRAVDELLTRVNDCFVPWTTTDATVRSPLRFGTFFDTSHKGTAGHRVDINFRAKGMAGTAWHASVPYKQADAVVKTLHDVWESSSGPRSRRPPMRSIRALAAHW